MTRMDRTFPTAVRLVAVAIAVSALALTGPIASADPPSQGQVDAAKDAKDAAFAELDRMNAELTAIQGRLTDAAFEVDRHEGLVEQVLVQLADTRERIRTNQARYEKLRAQLNDRSAEAYMDGPASSIGFVLDSTTMVDLSDRLEFVDAVASSDATLAQDVASVGYELSVDEARLSDLRQQRVEALDAAEQVRDQLQTDLARAQELRGQIQAKAADADQRWQQLTQERKDYLAKLAAQAAAPPPPPPGGGGPMPDSYKGLLQVCPVGQPRAFGDGFGAPRYVGGYHPHAGVDIVAPEGSPIYATFDGTARDATNSLGGNAVEVFGAYGYTYNAHMQPIDPARLGPVQAGDVIGFVSSTGLAGGTTPHDHFEFHPNVIPSSWPTSYYGYSVIGTAINPYPLLVDACY